MDTVEKTVRLYMTDSGYTPFEEWFDELCDARAQEHILARIARLRLGNPGDWKALGGSLFELRIDYGPGYRLYFGQEGPVIVILLVGGTKATQQRDIKRANEYWHDYQESNQAKDF